MTKPLDLTQQQCRQFRSNPSINPLTGKSIKPTKTGVYAKLAKICGLFSIQSRRHSIRTGRARKTQTPHASTPQQSNMALTNDHCKALSSNPYKNPLTERKINPTAKTGTYAQLIKLCKDLETKHLHSSRSPSQHSQSRTTRNHAHFVTPSKTMQKRQHLIDVIRKRINPILNKGDSLKSRVQFYSIMSDYLKDLEPCVRARGEKLALYKTSEPDTPIVHFNRRIGSESVYGIAYMNMGKGFARLLKFSCKLMSADVVGHTQEIRLYEHMSYYVQKEIFPNFPITYKTLLCENACSDTLCPKQTKKRYYVVINELASYDIQSWFKESHTEDDYKSVITQLIFAIYAFHGMGMLHRDCHLGNFLIHKITPGGFWRYQFEGQDIFVPNTGYLLVMWDPGLAKPYDASLSWHKDYYRALNLIWCIRDGSVQSYVDQKLVGLPNKLNDKLPGPLAKLFSSVRRIERSEREVMRQVIEGFKKNKYVDTIHVRPASQGGAPGRLLNIRPYNLDATLITEVNIFLQEHRKELKDICVEYKGKDLINVAEMANIEGTNYQRFGMLAGMSKTEFINLAKFYQTHFKKELDDTPGRLKSPWYKKKYYTPKFV